MPLYYVANFFLSGLILGNSSCSVSVTIVGNIDALTFLMELALEYGSVGNYGIFSTYFILLGAASVLSSSRISLIGLKVLFLGDIFGDMVGLF